MAEQDRLLRLTVQVPRGRLRVVVDDERHVHPALRGQRLHVLREVQVVRSPPAGDGDTTVGSPSHEGTEPVVTAEEIARPDTPELADDAPEDETAATEKDTAKVEAGQ